MTLIWLQFFQIILLYVDFKCQYKNIKNTHKSSKVSNFSFDKCLIFENCVYFVQ